MSAVLEELKKSASGAVGKARLVLVRTTTSNEDGHQALTTLPEPSSSEESIVGASDRLEELAEYCPKLTLQQRLVGFASSFSLGCTYLQKEKEKRKKNVD